MAITHKLVITYNTADGTTVHTYKYITPNMDAEGVQYIANAIIANGSIFKNVPVSVKAAKLVSTEETTFNVA